MIPHLVTNGFRIVSLTPLEETLAQHEKSKLNYAI